MQSIWIGKNPPSSYMAYSKFDKASPALENLGIFFADFGKMAWKEDWIKKMKSGYTTGNVSILYLEENNFIITNEYFENIPPFHIHRDLLVKLVNAWKEIYQKHPDRIDLTQEGNKFTFEYDTLEDHQTIVIE